MYNVCIYTNTHSTACISFFFPFVSLLGFLFDVVNKSGSRIYVATILLISIVVFTLKIKSVSVWWSINLNALDTTSQYLLRSTLFQLQQQNEASLITTLIFYIHSTPIESAISSFVYFILEILIVLRVLSHLSLLSSSLFTPFIYNFLCVWI